MLLSIISHGSIAKVGILSSNFFKVKKVYEHIYEKQKQHTAALLDRSTVQ